MKIVSARQLLLTFVPSVSVLLAMIVASALLHVSPPTVTRDTTAIANVHPLTGVLSNLGILLWSVAASICAFSAITLRGFNQRVMFWFLLSSGLLSAYLLLDDLFLIHEYLVPRYLGLDENVAFASLGIAVAGYLIAFRRAIFRTNFGVLALALGLLTTSVVVDVILEPWLAGLGEWEYFVEDGAKWLGIAAWCSYYVQTSHQALVGAFGAALTTGAVQSPPTKIAQGDGAGDAGA